MARRKAWQRAGTRTDGNPDCTCDEPAGDGHVSNDDGPGESEWSDDEGDIGGGCSGRGVYAVRVQGGAVPDTDDGRVFECGQFGDCEDFISAVPDAADQSDGCAGEHVGEFICVDGTHHERAEDNSGVGQLAGKTHILEAEWEIQSAAVSY